MISKYLNKVVFSLIVFGFLVESIFAQSVFFTENQSALVKESQIDGSEIAQLATSVVGLYGIATDYINNKIYYTNVVADEIIMANIDGTSSSVILNNADDGVDGPRGIVVDNKNNKLYWVEAISGKLRSADLEGNNATDIITGLASPVDVALDLENNLVHWSENGVGQKKISRSNLDGTSIITYLSGGLNFGGIEFDVENENLYFFFHGDIDYLYVFNTSTNLLTLLLNTTGIIPRGLALDRYSGKLFWTDVSDSSVNTINLDGTNQTKIISNLQHPIGISADNPLTPPVLVQLNTMLEGPYNTISNEMGTELLDSLPTKSPYIENPRIVDNIPADITDWALVELRETENGPAVASKSVLLHKDGRLVADDGTNSTIRISADPKPYYIVVKHRNHLPIMSSAPLNLTTN